MRFTTKRSLAALLVSALLPVIHGAAIAEAAGATFTSRVHQQSSDKCTDLPNGSASNGVQLQLWTCWSGANQRFTFVPVSGTTDRYTIHTVTSGSCVDISGASTSDNAAVIQWTCHTGANQRFRLRPVSVSGAADTFNLVAVHSGKCIAPSGDATANGVKLVQLPCSTSTARVWRLPGHASGGSLPASFQWVSSGPLIGPKSDATHNIRAVKDPSVVYHNGRWHVFATTTNSNGAYSMVYLNFTDWSQAGAASHYYLDQTAIGGGYKAAPQVFYFAPQKLWYLVYQTGDNAAYSTTTDLGNPWSWSAPRKFYANGMPQIIRDNIGNGHWVDFWVTCDSAKCHLFSSDDNGHLYRSETTVADYPNGFANTVIAMEEVNKARLWEAANVYRLEGSNTYLLLVEAIGSDGRRWFRSWTAPAITGPWRALADTEDNPFARWNNVTFAGTAWTRDISHGEMIRSGIDQNLTISPCNLRYVYQGMDPNSSDPYNFLPWRLGLLTQTNSPCSGATATINGSTTYQRIDGFGFSEHFGRANIMRGSDGLPEQKQREVLDLLLDRSTGAGMSMLRLGISSGSGSIEPTDPGGPDAPPKYVWDGDDDGQVWLAQQAEAYGVTRFYADAWSAPGYMKTNGSETNGGTLCGLSGTSCASGDWRRAYANYLAQYAKFYAQEGIDITDLGFTNEPDWTTSYASMRFTPAQAVEFAKIFGPIAHNAGLKTTCCEAVGWDGQKNYTNAIEADSTARGLVDVHTGHAYSSPVNGPLATSKPAKWTVRSDGSIVGVQSGRCLSTADGSAANGARIVLFDCNGQPYQRWSRA